MADAGKINEKLLAAMTIFTARDDLSLADAAKSTKKDVIAAMTTFTARKDLNLADAAK